MGTKTTWALLCVVTIFLSSVTIVSNAANTRTPRPKTKNPPTDVYPSDLTQDDTDPTHPFMNTTATSTTAELTTTVSMASPTTTTTTSRRPTATSSNSQIRPPLDDQNDVALFTIDTHSGEDGLLEVEFSKDVITKFHDCLCNADTNVCRVITTSTTAIDINVQKLEPPSKSPTYRCSADNNNSFACYRLAAADRSHCQDEDHCVPDFTTYGPDCPLGTVDVFWSDSQTVVVYVWSRQIKNIFACNSSCPPSTNDHDDDDLDTSSKVDDSVSPVVIGIIIACSVIVLLMFTALVVWVLKVRRNSPATAGHPVSGRVTSTDGLIIGQEGDFHSMRNYPVIRENGALKSKSPTAPELETKSNRYSNIKTRNNANRDATNGKHDLNHSNNNNPRDTNLNNKTEDEHTYSHTNDTTVNNPGEYSALDSATQYTRTYSALIPPFRDPRLLPPLPIPAKRSSEPLPYYSVAKPFTEFNAPNIDAVSGQYIELINEPNMTLTPDQNKTDISEIENTSHSRDNSQANQNSDESNKNPNFYFELEKETVHYASTSVQDLDYCLAGDGINQNVQDNTP